MEVALYLFCRGEGSVHHIPGTVHTATVGAGSDHDVEYVPGRPFAIFIQVSNRGRNGCIKSCFFQYISLPMKYTVSGSILQYKY